MKKTKSAWQWFSDIVDIVTVITIIIVGSVLAINLF